MFELRFRAVIERQEWNVPSWQNMEYDEFDNREASARLRK